VGEGGWGGVRCCGHFFFGVRGVGCGSVGPTWRLEVGGWDGLGCEVLCVRGIGL